MRPITDQEMLDQLVHALVQSKNEAADDCLLEALRLGNDSEKALVLAALMRRQTTPGLCGVVSAYDTLPGQLQLKVLQNIKLLHPALRECGRSEQPARRLAAMKLIALGRQGKLTYVLSDSLHSADEALSKGAVEALVALARWVATETKRLQKTPVNDNGGAQAGAEGRSAYVELIEQRPDIEQAVARALDVHRGGQSPEILRAALLLADWTGSKTLAILHTAKHGGQAPMVRRLQQPPEAEQVDAFLLGASHGGLRSHFGMVFGHIEEAPVLDALLRKTHWLKDHQLQLCMHQVNRGVWWGEEEMLRDLQRRDPSDAGKIGEWIGSCGLHDVVQDERMEHLRAHAATSFEGRLRLFRIGMRRPKAASVALLRSFLMDTDERLVRMAAREIVRRRPPEFESILMQLMTSAPLSVRRVISRSVGQVGFEHFWNRFDRMERSTRKAAGKAMLKILPDGVQRLGRRLAAGPVQQQIKAIQIAQELGVVDSLSSVLQQLCNDANPKLRSKAVSALGELRAVPAQVLMDKVLNDSDSRVRANAIEVLETKERSEYLPLLMQRARNAQNRERANAIKALHRMKVGTISNQLSTMLLDERPEHRISALWTLKKIGWWKLINEVGRLAKGDPNVRVRRYAFSLLKDVSDMLKQKKAG